jgi:hypothetical protein
MGTKQLSGAKDAVETSRFEQPTPGMQKPSLTRSFSAFSPAKHEHSNAQNGIGDPSHCIAFFHGDSRYLRNPSERKTVITVLAALRRDACCNRREVDACVQHGGLLRVLRKLTITGGIIIQRRTDFWPPLQHPAQLHPVPGLTPAGGVALLV